MSICSEIAVIITVIHVLEIKMFEFCVDDFDVPGETLFDRVTINNGLWWFCRFENDDHLLLDSCKGKELRISKKSYDKHFKDFIIGE